MVNSKWNVSSKLAEPFSNVSSKLQHEPVAPRFDWQFTKQYVLFASQATVYCFRNSLWSLLRAEKSIYVVNTCNCAHIIYKEYNKITGSVIKVVYLHFWNRSKPLLIVHGDQREKKAQLHKEAEPFSNVKLFQVQLYFPLEQAVTCPCTPGWDTESCKNKLFVKITEGSFIISGGFDFPLDMSHGSRQEFLCFTRSRSCVPQ